MALVARQTKSCGTTQFDTEVIAGCTTIKAHELDADFNALVGVVNALDHTNLITGAGIRGNQIDGNAGITGAQLSASAGILGTQLAPSTVGAGQLAPGAPTNNRNFGFVTSAFPGGALGLTAVPQTLLTASFGVALKSLSSVVLAIATLNVNHPTDNLCQFRLLRDGGATVVATVFSSNAATNGNVRFPILIVAIDVPAELSPTYTVDGLDQAAVGTGAIAVDPSTLRLVEIV